jgi:hypothetical protein
MMLTNLWKHLELVLFVTALVAFWYLAPKSPVFRAQVSGTIIGVEQHHEQHYPVVQFVLKNGETRTFTEKNLQTIMNLREFGLGIGDDVPVVYPLYDADGSYVGVVGRGWLLVETFYHAIVVMIIGVSVFILLLRLTRRYR